MDFLKDIKELSKEELIDVMLSYNDYVQMFYEDHEDEDRPVCISEYYYNDYQL